MKLPFFKQTTAAILCCVVLAFVALNLYSIFYKPRSKSLPVRIFNRFALIGPFFEEDRIQIVPHLKIRVKEDNAWGQWRDYEHENFLQYHNNPLRYDKLME